jgi:hypothetical protein
LCGGNVVEKNPDLAERQRREWLVCALILTNH